MNASNLLCELLIFLSLQILPECMYSVILDGLVGLEEMGEGDRLDGN